MAEGSDGWPEKNRKRQASEKEQPGAESAKNVAQRREDKKDRPRRGAWAKREKQKKKEWSNEGETRIYMPSTAQSGSYTEHSGCRLRMETLAHQA